MKLFVFFAILASAIAQPPTPTIKIRTGFDKKHKPLYTSAEVRSGFILMASKGQGDPQFIYSHGTVPEVRIPFAAYSVCGVEATYAVGQARPTRVWDARSDVSYAVLGQKLYLIPPTALAAGTLDDAPLDILSQSAPMPNLEALRQGK
jgi:hypothetical protein